MSNSKMTWEDYKLYIEKLFLIINKESQTEPFILNEPQTQILKSLTGRDVILKARQEGISSLILAIFAIDFMLFENVRCVVISHEKEATQKLFDKVKFYLESMQKTFPGELPYKLTYNSRHEMVNKEKNSIFYIGTAGSRSFGHGDTINNLHVSELSRWPDQETLMVGLLQAVPRGGRVVVETTANGIGNYFYRLWKRSQAPGSTFKTHFLPWFAMKEYKIPCKDGFTPNEEEVELQKAYGVNNEQLNWRRWKISELNDNIDAFNEQFPANAEEAFIVSGNPIWSPNLLKWYLHRCEKPVATGELIGSYKVYFEDNPKGGLKIWRAPRAGHDYVIGADVAEGISQDDSTMGKKESDYSCAYVLDRQTAELVACWHGHIAGDQFGRVLDLLGRFYNQAFIGVEKNYQGLAPLIMLRELNYPYLYFREKIGVMGVDKTTAEMGWRTDRFTRPMMVEEGSKWLRERRLTLFDEDLVGEMMSFIRYPDGQGRAAPSSFDDRVMAMLITIQMYIRNPRADRGNEIEQGGESYSMDGGSPIDSGDMEDLNISI